MAAKLILQLETATKVCSVALSEDGIVLALKELNEANVHAGNITLFIEQVMQAAGKAYPDLHAVAVSAGPGSYTGLRIGVSVAKGLCYALDIPLISVSTLQAMSAGFLSSYGSEDEHVLLCPMIDARRMEVYNALYTMELSEIQPVRATILLPETFDNYQNTPIKYFGDGAGKCIELYSDKSNMAFYELHNSAAHLSGIALEKLLINDIEDTAAFEPFYLKDFVAKKPAGS